MNDIRKIVAEDDESLYAVSTLYKGIAKYLLKP